MTFFAILIALLLEQVRPLARANPIHAGLRAWARWAARNFDAGGAGHGWLAWSVATVLPALITLGVHWGLVWLIGWPAALVWSVAVLYATLGFRQFSHHFTAIRAALDAGDEAQARELLAQWQQVEVAQLPRREIVRHVIEYSVLAAHRHVFGVLAWTSVLAAVGLGPAGAVLYRMSEFVTRYWRYRDQVQMQPCSQALQRASARAWAVIDWAPSRATALAFAVVGSFEEAIEGWRHHAQRFPDDNDGVVLAATSGAVGVRLGGEPLKPATQGLGSAPAATAPEVPESEGTPGREAEPAHLRSVVGLVWRSVVLWMVLLALLTLARLLG